MDEVIRIATFNWRHHEGSIGKLIDAIDRYAPDDIRFYHFAELTDRKVIDRKKYFPIGTRAELSLCYHLRKYIGIMYGLGVLPTHRMLRRLDRIRPDVIHIHCPNMGLLNIYMLLLYAGRHCIPVMITNHCEMFYTNECSHAEDCIKYQSGCGKCPQRSGRTDWTRQEWKWLYHSYQGLKNPYSIAVSPWQLSRMVTSPLLDNFHKKVIYNGVDTGIYRLIKDSCELRRELNLPDSKGLVLHVTSHFSDEEGDLKGGKYILEAAGRCPDLEFVVAGNADHLTDRDLPANLRVIGYIASEEELARYYNAAELTLVTSRRETYGMTCAESLCCGTPVAGFEAGGTESIALKEYTEFVPWGQTDELIESIRSLVKVKRHSREKIAQAAANLYDSRIMARKYCGIYHEMMDLEKSVPPEPASGIRDRN